MHETLYPEFSIRHRILYQHQLPPPMPCTSTKCCFNPSSLTPEPILFSAFTIIFLSTFFVTKKHTHMYIIYRIIIVRVEGSAAPVIVTFIFVTFLLNIIPIFRGFYIYIYIFPLGVISIHHQNFENVCIDLWSITRFCLTRQGALTKLKL